MFNVYADGRNVVIGVILREKGRFQVGRNGIKASVQTDGFFNIRNDRRLIIRIIYVRMKKLFEEEKQLSAPSPDVSTAYNTFAFLSEGPFSPANKIVTRRYGRSAEIPTSLRDADRTEAAERRRTERSRREYLRDVPSYEGFKKPKCYLRKLDRTRNKKRNKSTSRRIRLTVSLDRWRFHSHGSFIGCPRFPRTPFCLLLRSISSELSLDKTRRAGISFEVSAIEILGILCSKSVTNIIVCA